MIKHFNDMDILNERVKAKMDIPQDVKDFHKLFTEAGHKLYLVGGCVRDFLMGKKPHDFDLVSDALPFEMIEILKDYRTDIHGVKFGVVRVYTESQPLGYEVATYRKDVSKGRSNKGDDQKVEIGKHITINDDVRRRDISINALYYDLDTHEIVDAVGGIQDLNSKIIRAVGVPQKRFDEDRLRILRTLRFAAVTGGKIDKKTSDAIKKDNRLFGISEEDDVSRERIFAEFLKVKEKGRENDDPAILTRFIDLLIDYDILKQIFPVLVTTKTIRPTTYLSCALGQTLKNNKPNDKFKETLIEAKIPSRYVEMIAFLIRILRDGVKPETVYELYREMSSKDIRTDILAEWIRVMGITDPMVEGLLKYRPTTNGRDVMRDGFKGEEIGKEISRREGEKYVELVKSLNENKIIRFGDFQKGING
jgi:tRNA nucleotidyltransferase/poly(A) polymerase